MTMTLAGSPTWIVLVGCFATMFRCDCCAVTGARFVFLCFRVLRVVLFITRLTCRTGIVHSRLCTHDDLLRHCKRSKRERLLESGLAWAMSLHQVAARLGKTAKVQPEDSQEVAKDEDGGSEIDKAIYDELRARRDFGFEQVHTRPFFFSSRDPRKGNSSRAFQSP